MGIVGSELGSAEGRGLPDMYTPDREPVGELGGGVFLLSFRSSVFFSLFLFSLSS